MKIYRLSSTAERLAAVLISVILILSMILLCCLFSRDAFSLIICALCSVLVSAALIFYVANIMKAAVIPQPDGILTVKGIDDTKVNISSAVLLETAALKTGPVATRTLIFRDEAGEVVTSVPAFFTSNQGAQAEPLAMELAEAMGLTFNATLEPWEYDRKLRKQHMKEVALEEKEQRRRKLRALKNKILRRAEPVEADPVPTEEEDLFLETAATDDINYDALDDEK
jgi:hypothetical protein